jgi:peptidoglycan/LPS O-acetylase OafA/YrhL
MSTKTISALHIGATADRIAGFDLLRGICALSVVIYHGMLTGKLGQVTNLGTYPVYIFFVLSGASMYVAYADKFARGYSVARFLALRLIRLMPLYVAALVVWLAIEFARNGFSLRELGLGYLNVFFLFGLGNPGSTSQVVGGWSLGIEFVFYLLFPAALSLVGGRRWPWLLLIAFTTQHVFINATLGNGKPFRENWPRRAAARWRSCRHCGNQRGHSGGFPRWCCRRLPFHPRRPLCSGVRFASVRASGSQSR